MSTETSPSPLRRIRILKKHPLQNSNLSLFIMCLPALLLLLVFKYIPMAGIIMAFKEFNVSKGFLGSDWIGFRNFEFFFASHDIWIILRNTLVMNILFIAIGMATTIFVALLLNEISNKTALKTYQTILFFPYFLSWVVVSFLVYAYLSHDYGIVNSVIEWFGGDPVSWYTTAYYWPIILLGVSVWKGLGYGSVVYYTALLGIDQDYYDAASMDGANKLQTIRHISLPFLKPLIIILVILGIGGIMYSDFGLFFQVTRNQGALYPYTDVIDTYVYRTLLHTGDSGIASAVNFIQSIAGFLLVVGTNAVVRKLDEDSALY